MNLKEMFHRINKIDTFSPYFFFPFVIILYFFTSLFDFHRFEYFYIQKSVWLPIFIGIVSYYIAAYIVQKKQIVFPTFGLSFLKGKTVWFLYVLGIIGLVSYFTMVFTGQIGISDESIRRNLDPKLNFFSSLVWFSVIFLVCERILKETKLTMKKKVTYGLILITVVGMFIMMGYRTPIAIIFFTLFIVFHYVIKRVKLTWFLATLFTIGILFSLFGFFRVVTEDQTKEFNKRDGPDVVVSEEVKDSNLTIQRKINETPKWIRALNEPTVTGHIVLSKIIEYTDKEGYSNGRFHLAIFETVLPGEQLSPRMQVTEMVNSLSVKDGKYITREGRTTTPTIVGQFFIDGGYVAIVIGFALVGAVISMLYNQMMQMGVRSYQTITYAFVTTILTISIHTGLLDLIFILMIGYAILSASIECDRDKKKLI